MGSVRHSGISSSRGNAGIKGSSSSTDWLQRDFTALRINDSRPDFDQDRVIFLLNWALAIKPVYVKREWWISHFEIREEMNKTSFLSIRNFCIFLTYQTTDYNSIYRLRQQKYLENLY
jgi:hypothetical protein